jgi:hypothetical protein
MLRTTEPVRRIAHIDPRGQTLVETALVLPLFLVVVFGIVTFGVAIFYQQQVATAAREAARFAAVHSASSDCPVNGWLLPDPGSVPTGAASCGTPDSPANGWPAMNSTADEYAFGMNPADLHVTACWSSYHDAVTGGFDAGPYYAGDPSGATPNAWSPCTMHGGVDPLAATDSLPCPATTSGPSAPQTLDGDDQGSNLAVSDRQLAVSANRVVVYACYTWAPPLAGFLGIPNTFTFRAVISEALHHQR